jgi:hypothetical protein
MNQSATLSIVELYNRLPLDKQSEVMDFIAFLLSKPSPPVRPVSMPPPVDVGFTLTEEWLIQAKNEGRR